MELISREEVNKILHNQRETQSRVNQLPTYDACYLGSPCVYQNEDIKIPHEERKTGRWMQVEWGKTLLGKKIVTYRCSRCAEYLDFKGLNCGRGRAWYCPNCGAKMEGSEEDAEKL